MQLIFRICMEALPYMLDAQLLNITTKRCYSRHAIIPYLLLNLLDSWELKSFSANQNVTSLGNLNKYFSEMHITLIYEIFRFSSF